MQKELSRVLTVNELKGWRFSIGGGLLVGRKADCFGSSSAEEAGVHDYRAARLLTKHHSLQIDYVK